MNEQLVHQMNEIKQMIANGEKRREEAKDSYAEQFSILKEAIGRLGTQLEERTRHT